jgi:hypothetical protein
MYLVKVDDPGTKAHPNASYNPNLLTATTPAESWPGLTTQLDLPLDPISGTACEDPAVPARPELLQVSTPVVPATGSRQITVQADFIGPAGTATGPTGVRATLTDDRTGQVQTLTRANGGIVSWTPGSGSTPDTIVLNVPGVGLLFRPGPKQLTITTANANGGVSSVNGLTVHVMGANGGWSVQPAGGERAGAGDQPRTPAERDRRGGGRQPAGALARRLQREPAALEAAQAAGPRARAGSWRRTSCRPATRRIPRFNIPGTVIDGRYFQQNATDYDNAVAAHAPYAGVSAAHPGAARGRRHRAGQEHHGVRHRHRRDRVVQPGPDRRHRPEHRAGRGRRRHPAPGVDQQHPADQQRAREQRRRGRGGIGRRPAVRRRASTTTTTCGSRTTGLIGNGGLTQAGGIGIFNGANAYEVAGSIVCSNFSVELRRRRLAHRAQPRRPIHDNQIYYNDSVDSGRRPGHRERAAGRRPRSLGAGTGTVDVDRNLIQSNYSGDDGGGIFVLDALTAAINIRNNLIDNNGAADIGGAITLDDASNVRLINNTVAEQRLDRVVGGLGRQPALRGLASEANDPLFQAMLPAGSPDFSRPVRCSTTSSGTTTPSRLSSPGPGRHAGRPRASSTSRCTGRCSNDDRFTPRLLRPDQRAEPRPGRRAQAGAGRSGQPDRRRTPGFATPFVNELTVSGSRLDPQTAAVTITGQDPPVGLTGDYHLGGRLGRGGPRRALLDHPGAGQPQRLAPPRGAGADRIRSTTTADYRPSSYARATTPWDLGADERPGRAAGAARAVAQRAEGVK